MFITRQFVQLSIIQDQMMFNWSRVHLYRPTNDHRTGNDPQIGPQMIPDRLTTSMKWNGLNGQWKKTL